MLRELGSILRQSRVTVSIDHPAQFPIALPAEYIKAFGAEAVYDPFMGSGTTLIAAEQLGSAALGMEINPKYCDVAVRRWSKMLKRGMPQPKLIREKRERKELRV
jgi:DNA modification methylase